VKDIVDRLMSLAECDARAGEPLGKCMRDAAEEITRLRKELKQGTEMLCNQAETILNYRATVEDLIWALNEIAIADRDGPMAKIASTAVALACAKGGDREGHR
jgi:hypothetical protein